MKIKVTWYSVDGFSDIAYYEDVTDYEVSSGCLILYGAGEKTLTLKALYAAGEWHRAEQIEDGLTLVTERIENGNVVVSEETY